MLNIKVNGAHMAERLGWQSSSQFCSAISRNYAAPKLPNHTQAAQIQKQSGRRVLSGEGRKGECILSREF